MDTAVPTEMPAVDVVAQTTYIIAIRELEGATANEANYEADLRAAMDLLAPQVSNNITLDSRRLRAHIRATMILERRLQSIAVDLPTSVDGRIRTGTSR